MTTEVMHFAKGCGCDCACQQTWREVSLLKFTYENGLWPQQTRSRLRVFQQEDPKVIKDNVQERHDFDAGNKACSMKMTSIMRRTEQRSWQQYSKNCHSEQGAAVIL